MPAVLDVARFPYLIDILPNCPHLDDGWCAACVKFRVQNERWRCMRTATVEGGNYGDGESNIPNLVCEVIAKKIEELP